MENNNQVLKIKGYYRGYIQKFWGVQWKRQPIVCSESCRVFPEGMTFGLNLEDMLGRGNNTKLERVKDFWGDWRVHEWNWKTKL